MKKRMRVVVWGPGGLGTVAIRKMSMLPEFELVGVCACSPAKHGVDAGTLIGIAPLGVKASTNADEVLAIDCDAVLYTARDLATFNNDDEIVRLLAAGKKLVTALPYHYMHVTRPPEYVARVEAAADVVDPHQQENGPGILGPYPATTAKLHSTRNRRADFYENSRSDFSGIQQPEWHPR